MGKINKNDYLSLLTKHNLMDAENIQGKLNEGFFTYQVTVELAAVGFSGYKMYKADETKAINQVHQTQKQLNPLSQETSNLQTGRARSAQLRGRHCSSHLLSAGTYNQLMIPAQCWAQEAFSSTQKNDFCALLQFTLIFTLLTVLQFFF